MCANYNTEQLSGCSECLQDRKSTSKERIVKEKLKNLQSLPGEEWRKLPKEYNLSSYEISSFGRVKSLLTGSLSTDLNPAEDGYIKKLFHN
jgi:hypothetical protein